MFSGPQKIFRVDYTRVRGPFAALFSLGPSPEGTGPSLYVTLYFCFFCVFFVFSLGPSPEGTGPSLYVTLYFCVFVCLFVVGWFCLQSVTKPVPTLGHS